MSQSSVLAKLILCMEAFLTFHGNMLSILSTWLGYTGLSPHICHFYAHYVIAWVMFTPFVRMIVDQCLHKYSLIKYQ